MSAFTEGQHISSGATPSSVEEIKTGDFNGDGVLDIAVSRIFYGAIQPIQLAITE